MGMDGWNGRVRAAPRPLLHPFLTITDDSLMTQDRDLDVVFRRPVRGVELCVMEWGKTKRKT
jgi:hypothetical protein